MKTGSSAASGLSLFLLLLMLLSLGGRFWAVEQTIRNPGPTHLVTGGSEVFLFAAGDIWRLTADGQLLARYPDSQTGLQDDPIDLQWTGDGRLVLAEQRPARIRFCNTESWVCEETAKPLAKQISRQFKLLFGVPGMHMVATDARGGMLWGWNPSSDSPREMLPAGTLAGPNGLIWTDTGMLWVADTDHRRIVSFEPGEDGTFSQTNEHSAVNSLTRAENHYPMMLETAPDGMLWVLQAADFSVGTADLVVYHPETGVNTVVELPGSLFPTDIALAGTDMLVTDLEQFEVYRINTQTYQVSPFGDQEFRQQLGALRDQNEAWLRMSLLALIGVILFGILMIVTAVRATPKSKRWTTVAAPLDLSLAGQPIPRVSGIHWLERDSKVERMLKRAEISALMLMAVLWIMLLGAYGWALSQAGSGPETEVQNLLDKLGSMLALSVFASIVMIVGLRQGLRPFKTLLGSDGVRVHIQLPDGRRLAASTSELCYTGRSLMVRNYLIPLQGGNGRNLYVPGELDQWIAPLLADVEQITPFQAFIRQMKRN